MANAKTHEDFVAFMVDYTAFLAQMCADESDKLKALSSRELSRIEHSITVSQANAKRLQNLEQKREAMQHAAGYDGLTFRQLIEKAQPGEQEKMWKLFASFEHNVTEIRFYNDKSMAVARDNMVEIDPEAALPAAPGAKAANPYEKMRAGQQGQGGLLETKV